MWCCADYGITPGDLASELNIAASSIERVMVGEDGITFSQLRKIAEYFGRGVLFFWSMDQLMRNRCIRHNFEHLPTRNRSCPPASRN